MTQLVNAPSKLRRTLSAAALAALAVTGLSACQSKVGLAASVDGHRLSDAQLSSYVKAGAQPYSDSASNTTVVPKVYVLQNWIENQLFVKAVTKKGGPATDSELRAARTAVLSGQTIDKPEAYYIKLGYTKKFADLIIEQSARLVVLVERIAPGISPDQALSALQNNQAGNELFKAVTSTKPHVVVSPRYGKWDAAKVTLTSTSGAGAPNFVRFATTAPGASLVNP